eukprot:1192181-Prorocentrum_minimum.AAC.1
MVKGRRRSSRAQMWSHTIWRPILPPILNAPNGFEDEDRQESAKDSLPLYIRAATCMPGNDVGDLRQGQRDRCGTRPQSRLGR